MLEEEKAQLLCYKNRHFICVEDIQKNRIVYKK